MDSNDSRPVHGKDLRDFAALPRRAFGAYRRRQALPHAPGGGRAERASAPFQRLKTLLASNISGWFREYLRFRIGRTHPFPGYHDPQRDNGVYPLHGEAGEVRIALAGDWGTGTDEAHSVAERIAAFKPHYSVHLGDIYFVGDPAEVRENFLGEADPRHRYRPCRWPHGSHASFALNGNHEMLARGYGYFDLVLPRLGPMRNGRPQGQQASFFCLENEHWRIIGLDTGYRAIGIPLLENLPFFQPDCALPEALVQWLRQVVFAGADNRGIVLLSHHQYCSLYDTSYPRQAAQLAAFIKRPVLWFWGHEHRMVIYAPFQGAAGITAHGRCIGHGGMPVDLPGRPVRDAACEIEFIDARVYQNDENLRVGYNGFARLVLRGATLLAEYVDLNGTLVFREIWTADPAGQLARSEATAFVAPQPGVAAP